MSTAATEYSIDFRAYYDLESYLFGTVSQRFADTKTLSAFDFFCIVIWKANRAKSRIARRLLTHKNYPDFDTAVRALLAQIATVPHPKDKLYVLFEIWGFELPTASAILTVLYPEEFSVYDYRVCYSLGDFHKLTNKSRYESVWDGYVSYLAAVKRRTPDGLTLRDKDRWLWGESFCRDLEQDLQHSFGARS